MPRFYVPGPIRGIKDLNFPAFDAARNPGISKGHTVISPADIDRAHGIKEDSYAAYGPGEARAFARRDTEVILSLRSEEGDGIALLPGWELSKGALAEFALARWVELAMVNALTWEPFAPAELPLINLYGLSGRIEAMLLGKP